MALGEFFNHWKLVTTLDTLRDHAGSQWNGWGIIQASRSLNA
jgi:hypothetical protein